MALKEFYQKEVLPKLKEELGYKNIFATPRLVKVVVNSGINSQNRDQKLIDNVVETLKAITGQKPILTKARKSISGFKVRQGMIVGAKVTLRGQRMFDFLEKLINNTLPRLRDFRGLSKKNIDACGNLNLGFRESIAFPEVRLENIEKIHGLEVTVVTTAKNREEGFKLFKSLGFPFKEKE